MAASTSRRLIRTAGFVTAAALVSRVLGFVRNSVLADKFGQGPPTDMYNSAYIVPDAVYLILIGGGISSAFIPVISQYLARGEREEAWKVISIAFSLVLVGMSAVVALGLVFAPAFVPILAPGKPAYWDYTTVLTRIILASTLFLALAGVLVGAEYAFNSFWATSVGPVFYNVAIIGIGWLLAPRLGIAAFALAVVVGSFLNFAAQVVGVGALRPRYSFSLDWRHPGIRRIGQLMFPVMISIAATQIGLIVNQNMMASLLAPGVINALTISSRIMLLPVSFATSIGITLLPTLTSQATRMESEEFRTYFSQSLRAIIFLLLPASVGLMVLARPIVVLLFERGHFTAQNSTMTASALVFYAIGIVAYGAFEIVSRAFFALQDTVTPVKVAVGYLVISFGLNFLLMHLLLADGLALAYSISGFANVGLLVFFLRSRLGRLDGRRILDTTLRTLAASVAMGIGVSYVSTLLHPFWQGMSRTPAHILQVVVPILVGVFLFFFFAWLFRVEESGMVLGILENRLRRRKQRSARAS